MSKKSSPAASVFGWVIIAALAWMYWAIGGAGGVLDLVLGPLIAIALVAALTQAWRAPGVQDTKAGPALFRMHDGGMRLLEHPRVAVPATLVSALLLPPVLGAPALAAVLWLAGRPHVRTREPEPEPWYGPRAMVGHLARAGVLKEPAWLPQPPRLVRDDQHGSVADIHLPLGMTANQVIARRDALASSLRVAPARLSVEQIPDAPANVVRLFVGQVAPQPPRHRPHPGADALARPHPHRFYLAGPAGALATNEQNSLIGGLPGSGKTALARLKPTSAGRPSRTLPTSSGRPSRTPASARRPFTASPPSAGRPSGAAPSSTTSSLRRLRRSGQSRPECH